jgi:hypothetical protein
MALPRLDFPLHHNHGENIHFDSPDNPAVFNFEPKLIKSSLQSLQRGSPERRVSTELGWDLY